MANIFTLDKCESGASTVINLDELYEKRKNYDLQKLDLFNKILNRVHVRIKTTSAQKLNEPYCWFIVPEIIIGVPKYDQAACVAYIIDKLQNNSFRVKYIHPNALFISWLHWIPTYIRTEYKKKYGIEIDELGNEISRDNDDTKDDYPRTQEQQATSSLIPMSTNITNKIEYNSTKSYKPSGKLIYNNKMVEKFMK
jgi:hypothetical protein